MCYNLEVKIALVSPYAFTNEPGGVKDFILGLKSALEKKRHIVAVIAPGSKEAKEKGLVDFILGRSFKLSTDQTELTGSFSRKKTAKEILKRVEPDIVVIHEPFVPTIGHTIISTILRKDLETRPIVVGQFHASREDLGFRLKALEFIARHFIRRPKLDRKTILSLSSGYVTTINDNLDGRIAVSQATKKFWQGKLPADYSIIYNGIDTAELTPNPLLQSFGGARRIIFFAGRHDSRKGVDDLINAFNLLVQLGNADLRLKIAGEGEMTEELRGMVRKLGLESLVEFVGVLTRVELIRAYQTADLLVAPSVDGEGFNRTIAEARSCGTLVVCTEIEGQREAIGKDLAPFMAVPQDPRSLAKKIKAVLDLPDAKKKEIRKRGRDEAKARFDWETIAQEHLAFYESLLSKNKL